MLVISGAIEFLLIKIGLDPAAAFTFGFCLFISYIIYLRERYMASKELDLNITEPKGRWDS